MLSAFLWQCIVELLLHQVTSKRTN